MTKWRRVGDPSEFTTTSEVAEVDVGWSWRVERDGRYRQVRVIVVAGDSGASDLPEDSRQAIRSRGESAIDKVLDEEEPPTLIVVSSAGVRRA